MPTERLWDYIRNPSEQIYVEEEYIYSALMKNPSLLKIYHCIALAHISLNVDALTFTAPKEQLLDLNKYLFGTFGEDMIFEEPSFTIYKHEKKFTGEKLHKIFLPVSCALEQCDLILPRRLSYTVARYMSQSLFIIASGR